MIQNIKELGFEVLYRFYINPDNVIDQWIHAIEEKINSLYKGNVI